MGIDKKTRQRIKRYVAILSKVSPDYKYRDFLEIYERGDYVRRRFYEKEMEECFKLNPVDDEPGATAKLLH